MALFQSKTKSSLSKQPRNSKSAFSQTIRLFIQEAAMYHKDFLITDEVILQVLAKARNNLLGPGLEPSLLHSAHTVHSCSLYCFTQVEQFRESLSNFTK